MDELGHRREDRVAKIPVTFEGSNSATSVMESAVKHARAFDGRRVPTWPMLKGDEIHQEAIRQAEKRMPACA